MPLQSFYPALSSTTANRGIRARNGACGVLGAAAGCNALPAIVEALAVAASPVATTGRGGPAACLIPLIVDAALAHDTLVGVLEAGAAVAAVRLIHAVQVAIRAWR